MVNIVSLCKVIAKCETWKSISREAVELSSISGTRIRIPEKAANVFKISGERANGLKADFYIFRDKNGVNLGSHSLFSDGTERVITMNRGGYQFDSNLPMLYDDPKSLTVKNQLVQNGATIQETNLFSQTYIADKDLKGLSPKMYSRMTGEATKPEDVDKIYQSVVRVRKTPQSDGTTLFNQEIRQIETGATPSNKFVKTSSTMAEDGEIVLNSVEQQGVSIDTDQPHFQTILLEPHDMLKSNYARMVKERGFKGIEPPLKFSDRDITLFDKYICNGYSKKDGSEIALNMDKLLTRHSAIFTLGHECEHMFTQNKNIHLSGLDNLRSNNPISKRFYDGIEQRFPKIKSNSEEYKVAKEYAENFKDDVFDDNLGNANMTKWYSHIVEQHANIAGSKEKRLFLDCLGNITDNFSLFNTRWLS